MTGIAPKNVLITGGSRGIGAATARKFAANGYNICINYKENENAANALIAELQTMGVQAVAVRADVSCESETRSLFSEFDQHFGQLDVLVNNAGILQTQCRFTDISAQRFQHVLQTNIMSCVFCCQQAVKRMSNRFEGLGGAIVNVSSRAAITGSPNEYVDYAASKGAMDSITVGLAKEVANEGIRVNGVRPGLIYTEMHASGGEPNRVERLKSKIPMNRGGQADEVANAIYWLASEQASFTTGSFVDVSGGL